MEHRIYIEISKQIIILLKPSLLDMHLKSNTMSIYSCICTHNVVEKCIFNMSNMPPLFALNNLQHNFIFLIQVKIFEASQKSKHDPFLVDAKIRNLVHS